MNILLTGGRGFIGSHLLVALLRKFPDSTIVVADANTYAARPPLFIHTPSRLVFEKVDLRDELAVHRLMEAWSPEVIFHLAAESHVCRSLAGPKDFATTNIMGTFNLIEHARHAKVKRFIHVSTDEVFGEAIDAEGRVGFFDESTAYAPRSPYAATKAASDLLVMSYVFSYQFPAIVINMSNNFGPNQHPEKLVPKSIISILNRKPVLLHNDGQNQRDWLWVGDAVRGILQAHDYWHTGASYCLGGKMVMSNLDLVKAIWWHARTMEPDLTLDLEFDKEARPTDDRRYAIDCSAAKATIDWEPRPDLFSKRLRNTIRWYRHAMLSHGGGALQGRGAG